MKIFYKVVLNLTAAVVFIHGVVTNHPITSNLSKFYAGLVFFSATCMLILMLAKSDKIPVRKLPRWFNRTLDIATITTAAAFGWFWCAVAMTYGVIIVEASEVPSDKSKPQTSLP